MVVVEFTIIEPEGGEVLEAAQANGKNTDESRVADQKYMVQCYVQTEPPQPTAILIHSFKTLKARGQEA